MNLPGEFTIPLIGGATVRQLAMTDPLTIPFAKW